MGEWLNIMSASAYDIAQRSGLSSNLSSYMGEVLKLIPSDAETFIDLGCGLGDWGYMLKTRLIKPIKITGFEKWRPYLDRTRKYGVYDLLIHGDLTNYEFKDHWDVGLLNNVIEHLTRNEVHDLIDRLKACCGLIIIMVPRKLRQNRLVDGNERNIHRSFWDYGDLLKLGFREIRIHRGVALRQAPIELIKWFLGKRSGLIIAYWRRKQ